jgi:hypothetical protein
MKTKTILADVGHSATAVEFGIVIFAGWPGTTCEKL